MPLLNRSPLQHTLRAFTIPRSIFFPCLLVLLLLAFFPQIDIAVSNIFYDPTRGGFFLRESSLLTHVVDPVTSFASMVFIVVCCLLYALGRMIKRTLFFITFPRLCYLVVAFVVCPVLIVNYGFKEHWGRARPYMTQLYGGTQEFTPYYLPTDQCDSHCSFPSGHMVRSFYFMSLVFMAYASMAIRKQSRRRLLVGVLLFGVVAGFGRIATGYHFLSDVVVSAMLMTYVTWVLFRIYNFSGSSQPHTEDSL